MLKQYRFIFSATLIAVLFVSLFITPQSAWACEEPPQTLLSLYMNSDLIILANIEGDRIIKREEESEYGEWLEIERDLSIVQILKGQDDLKKISFTSNEYRANPNAPVETEEYEIYHDGSDDYFDISKVKTGTRYLFFLMKDKESGKYDLADYSSGVKDVAGKMDIYEKSLGELKTIVENKENQLANLTEWLVRSIEEPETRQDAISDLSESFYYMNYREQYPEEFEANQENPEEPETKPFALDESFSIYSSPVAKELTDSQKSRLSSVFYPLMQEAWFAQKPERVHYGIATILSSFDKSQLAIYSFNMLQSVDNADSDRKEIVIEFIVSAVNDQDLSNIYYEYLELERKITEQKTKSGDEAVKTKSGDEAVKQLNSLLETRENLLKNFDTRFQFMYARNFAPVETVAAKSEQ